MEKNKYFGFSFLLFLLIFLSFALICVFSVKTFLEIRNFDRLDKKTVVSINSWEIFSQKGKFLIKADYSYMVEGKKISQKKLFSNRKYLNYPSAVNYLSKNSDREFYIWYSSKNPDFSSFEKKFPLKTVIYGIVSLGVFFYFLFFKKRFLF